MRRLFRPTARQLNVLIPLGLVAFGYALYIRYLWVEQTPVGLACDGGLATWGCATRRLALTLSQHSVFGLVAIAAALLNLLRPSLLLFAIALVAAGFGIVLYNVSLSGLAVAFMILSLARPVRETI
ncbi:MAG: hypothetical protein M5U07_02435 [Xanthobacteraceae bacterium]|nr:hypothetical protein [Xanthobacteraceae bacterium]